MEILQEIARIFTPAAVKRFIPNNTRGGASSSKTRRLYHYLLEDDLTEEEIVVQLYGEGTTTADGRYRSLKSRLKRLMLEALIYEEASAISYASYDEAYISGFQQLGLARILIAQRAYRAAAEVASLAFRNVGHYEIIPLNEGLTDVLSALYLGALHDKKRFKRYYDLHGVYAQAATDVNIIARKYRLMNSKIYAHKESPATIGEISLGFVQETEHFLQQYPRVSSVQAMIRRTLATGLKLTGRYEEAVAAASEAEKALAVCPGVSNLVVSSMALLRVECLLQLRNFTVGKQEIDRTRKLIPADSINGVKLSEYAVSLGLVTGNYDYAYREILSLNRRMLKNLPNPEVEEFWWILEAYIHFLLRVGKIVPQEGASKLEERFRIGKFLNDVPTYAANKRGMNIQILVLQVMFFIVAGDFEKVTDRTGSLARYCNRYLKDNDNIRHSCFFRLLLELEKASFVPRRRQKAIDQIYVRMTSPESVRIGHRTSVEIIPYEVLWQIALEQLGSKDPS